MILTSEQLQQVVSAGGGLVIDGSTMTLSQLRQVVSTASINKATITVKRTSGLTAAQLAELAALAPGLVVFDLTT
jgi:hypothetical protein